MPGCRRAASAIARILVISKGPSGPGIKPGGMPETDTGVFLAAPWADLPIKQRPLSTDARHHVPDSAQWRFPRPTAGGV
ncbi:hypothetical protein PLUA15_230293 [Pseudomonas lundensis]|uniref:Uncharacterized protein n=1 Tax=Pseudomonas lundensis TaxID=86185 RepID=A0AAX2H8E4_9PSED|nr:hypothetical protein PLUA15_230293 [Pseudomonas lundensis]